MWEFCRLLSAWFAVLVGIAPYPTEGPALGPGSLSNPGSAVWEDVVDDRHVYPPVPHTADILDSLRRLDGGKRPVFLSEYGISSAVDLWRAGRHFEQNRAERLEDARFFQDKLNQFLADFQNWHLEGVFARPEDFFAASLRKMAGQRLLGLNAIRSNPKIILMVSIYPLGAGRFLLNTLRIRENLDHPVAQCLLNNMLSHAARDSGKPMQNLPVDFEARLREMGY